MLFALSDDPQTNDESEYSADMHIKTKQKTVLRRYEHQKNRRYEKEKKKKGERGG